MRSPPAIWNPSAAVGWSLVFTPAFGAYIHMHNWRALGDTRQAAAARRWLLASLCVLAIQIVTRAINARLGAEPLLVHPASVLLFALWYVGAARQQALLVRARFGPAYPRRCWDSVLLGAVAAGTAYAGAGALLSLAFVNLT